MTSQVPIDMLDPPVDRKPRAKTSSAQQLQRETEAARILRDQLAAIADGDTDAIRDTLEGVTSLHEIIAKVVEDLAADAANVEGIKAHMETMKARKERLEARIEVCRSAILNAMAIGEIKKLELPVATLSRKPVPPAVQIVDEAAIPSQFWKRADPKLDKRAIGDALKGKENVPGATLSNGGESLQIRFG